jgi:hypothetical protein
MSQRRKQRQRKSNGQQSAQKLHQQTKNKPLFSKHWRSWDVFLTVAAILSFVATVYFFFPKVQIIPYTTLNPSNPFSTPFQVVNKSEFSIYSVELSCAFSNVESSESNSILSGFRTINSGSTIKEVKSDESASNFCAFPFNFKSPISSADFEVCVKYRPSFWPIRLDKCFRFSTSKTVDGNLIWLPMALTQPNIER